MVPVITAFRTSRSLPVSEFGLSLEEAHDGVEALVGCPALYQTLHLGVVHLVETLLLRRADQLFGQGQALMGGGCYS